jgi:ketosteroid isomerase-like protein
MTWPQSQLCVMKPLEVLLLIALVGLSACSTTHSAITNLEMKREASSNRPVVGDSVPRSTEVEAERTKLLQTDLAFSRVSEEKGAAAAFYEFLTPEATSLPPGSFPIKGREAIRVHWSASPQGVLTWKPAEAEVARSGELGYTWGTYEFSVNGPDGRPQISYGKYVTIWKKQADGSWKVLLDTGNSSPPPTQRR